MREAEDLSTSSWVMLQAELLRRSQNASSRDAMFDLVKSVWESAPKPGLASKQHPHSVQRGGKQKKKTAHIAWI